MRAKVVYALFIVCLVAFLVPWSVASATNDPGLQTAVQTDNAPPPHSGPWHRHRHPQPPSGVCGGMNVYASLSGPGADRARIAMSSENTLNGRGVKTWNVNTCPKNELGLTGGYGIGVQGRNGGPVPYPVRCTFCTEGTCESLVTTTPAFVDRRITLNRPERGAQLTCWVAGW